MKIISPLSMIVPIVDKDKDDVFPFERKRKPPITAYFDGAVTSEFRSQWMKVVPRRIHVTGPAGHV